MAHQAGCLMSISHADCQHPSTPRARQACRRERALRAEKPAEALTMPVVSDDTGERLRTRQHRSSDAKRRIRHTLEALERAIDQNHPRRIRVFTTPADHVEGMCVEVGKLEPFIYVLDDDETEHKFAYSQIFSINFV